MFLQSYTQASRHSTTTLRYHHSQTRDVSNVSNEDAVKYFHYDIFLLSLMIASFPSLLKIPPFLSKDSQDFSHLFNRQCKTIHFHMEILVRKRRTTGNSHIPRVMARTRAKPKQRRAPIVTITSRHIIPMLKHRITTTQYSQDHTREGRGSKSRHHDSYQNWKKRNEGDYHYKSTDEWQPPIASRQPPQKGKGSQSDNPRTKGKVQQRLSEIELTATFLSLVKSAWLLQGPIRIVSIAVLTTPNITTKWFAHSRTFRTFGSLAFPLFPAQLCVLMGQLAQHVIVHQFLALAIVMAAPFTGSSYGKPIPLLYPNRPLQPHTLFGL